MELILRDGDYVWAEGQGLRTAEGAEERLERVLFQLTARRGAFPLLPDVGSQLWRLTASRSSRREDLARGYVAEALAGERDLEVEQVSLTEEDGHGRLTVRLTWNGEPLTVGLEIGAGGG